jgi:hypothetical protein
MVNTSFSGRAGRRVNHDGPYGVDRRAGASSDSQQLVVVPKEPTESMIAAGLEAIRHGDTWNDIVANIYKSMHDAAPSMSQFRALPGRHSA